MLQANNLNISYGKLQALWDVSCHVNNGEIVALISSNGAGKSTLLKSIIGLIKPVSGNVVFFGKEVKETHDAVKSGMSLVSSERMLFQSCTVEENLRLGGYFLTKSETETMMVKVMELFPILAERKNQLAVTLSGGEQQMLCTGRSLVSKPKLLLLDEPSTGLAPRVVSSLFKILMEFNKKEGIAMLLAEQNVFLALRYASRAYVLENGRIVLEEDSKKLLNDPYIKKVYLGELV